MVLVVLALLAASCDWTQYGYDAAQTGFNPTETVIGPSNASQLALRWSQPLAGPAVGVSPLVSNGVVYAGSESLPKTWVTGALGAFDAATGNPLWSQPWGTTVWWTILGWTPAVANGVLYGAAGYEGGLEATDLVTRQVLWAIPSDSFVLSVTFDGSTLFVDEGDALEAVDAATGSTRWTVPLASSLPANPPAVSAGLVYVVDGSSLEAYAEATGALAWSAPTPGMANPVASGGTVFVSGPSGVEALVATTGGLRWSRPDVPATGSLSSGPSPRTVGAGPAVANGVLYVPQSDTSAGHVPGISALDATTGATRWKTAFVADPSSKPAVANGVVYVGGSDSALHALDASTGSVLAVLAVSGPVSSSPAVANGLVYVSDDAGFVSAFGLPS